MKLLFVLFFLIIFSLSSFSQREKNVGFACGFAGSPTESVLVMEEFLYKMSFDTIRNGLKSTEPSIQFLSSIVVKRLDKEGLIKLTQVEKEEILKISLSNKYIHICYGCTEYEYLQLSNIYIGKDKMQIKRQAISWVDNILKEIN